MRTTKVFQLGDSQAVILPEDVQFLGDEIEIINEDGNIILREIPKNLIKAFTLLTDMPDDFFENGRNDEPPQFPLP